MEQEHIFLTIEDVTALAQQAAAVVLDARPKLKQHLICGVPRGGVPVAFAVANAINITMAGTKSACVVDDPREATAFVDDLVDSGITMQSWTSRFPNVPFIVLINKQTQEKYTGKWIIFPWEGTVDGPKQETVEDNVRRLLQYIGEDAGREGLIETPQRVASAYLQWFVGYRQDPAALFKSFLDGSEKHQGDEMVILRNVPVYSHCEHHMAPFFGEAHIGYIPQGKILGLSKMVRVVDCFARRLQVQERLTAQIADTLDQYLSNRGVGVIIEARHLCMESRGVESVGVKTVTSAMRGNLLLNQATRQEFLSLARNGG